MGMPPATRPGLYSGTTDSANARRMTKSMQDPMNPEYVFTGNANSTRPPLFFVRIWNVSDIEHRIERPWVNYNPTMRGKMIIIPARQDGKRVSRPFVISDVVQVPIRHVTTGEMDARGVDGKFLAQDALNPEEPQGNWKTVRPIGLAQGANEGTNLYHAGLFWDISPRVSPEAGNDELLEAQHAPPADDAVDMAIKRLEENYNRLIEEAKMLYDGGPVMRLQIGRTHRRAASYYDLEFPWNQVYRATQVCPGCSSRVSATAVVCPNCPAVFNWERALELGLRTVEDATKFGILEPQAGSIAGRKKRAKVAPKT